MKCLLITLLLVSLYSCDQHQNQNDSDAEERFTLLQYLKVDLKDVEIAIDMASTYKTGTFQRIETDDEAVLKDIKNSLESYLIVSLEESQNIAVHRIFTGTITFRLILEGGREVRVSKTDLMEAEYLVEETPPVYNKIILAPKEWIRLIRKS